MPQTKAGAIKAREAMIKKYGGLEGYREHMKNVGRKGGAAEHKTPRGFAAMTPQERSKAGRVGGLKSRKPNANREN